MSYSTKDVEEWNEESVSAWLTSVGLESYTSVFEENNICGSTLPHLNHWAFKEMEIQSVGERMKILIAIRKLFRMCNNNDASPHSSNNSAKEESLATPGVSRLIFNSRNPVTI